jgi:hypothetical protein
VIVDAEKLISRYLREHEAVAEVCSRIVATQPGAQTGGTDTPWVRVVELNAPQQPGSRAEWLVPFLLQFDCYAGKDGGQPEAKLIARTVREAIHDATGKHADGVVTSVRFVGQQHLPDGDLEPARERYILTATIHAHPAPA